MTDGDGVTQRLLCRRVMVSYHDILLSPDVLNVATVGEPRLDMANFMSKVICVYPSDVRARLTKVLSC